MKHEPPSIDAMLWIPGVGPDEKLLRDLAARFPKPSEPLGESWFMSKTRVMYDDLNDGGIEAVSNKNLDEYLHELIGGIYLFPGVRDWEAWYAYLVPRILLSGRFLDGEEAPLDISYLYSGLELLSWATAYYTQENPVLAYEADFARVLAPLIMHPQFWRDGHFKPTQKVVTRYGDWHDTSHCRFPTAMMLAWRYLPEEAIRPWLRSVLDIESAVWCFQLMLWLQEIAPILVRGSASYAVMNAYDLERMRPGPSTQLDHMKKEAEMGRHLPLHLEPMDEQLEAEARAQELDLQNWELIPPRNIAALREAIVEEFGEENCVEWMQFFAEECPKWPNERLAGLPQVLAELRG